MLTEEKQREAMATVRDQFFEALRQHEAEDHGGDPCIGNRISAVAYLAHSAGLQLKHCGALILMIEEYRSTCPQPKPEG